MYLGVIYLALPLCLSLAALTDFLEMKIPNRIPAILLASFFILAPFAGLSLSDFGWHLLAGAAVFSVCFALFALGVMGGGDAKLLTAAAVWFGFNSSLFAFLVYTAYLGGALTIAVIILRANWDRLAYAGIPMPQTLMMAKKVPYAIAIGAAGLLTYPQSPLVLEAISRIQ